LLAVSWRLLTTEAGNAVGMPHPTTWSIEYQVREDAESMFVPTDLLPHAHPGDFVEITSAQPPVTRRGRLVGPADADAETRGEFVTVTFD
jgi:hypothetical protein